MRFVDWLTTFARQHPLAVGGFVVYCIGGLYVWSLVAWPLPVGPNGCGMGAALMPPTMAVLVTGAYWVLPGGVGLSDRRRRQLYRRLWMASVSQPAAFLLTLYVVYS